MTHNNGNGDGLPDTLTDAPIGSPESRVAARRLLQSDNRPPDLIISFGEEKPKTATVGDRTFTRGDGETMEAFKARILHACPVVGPPKLIVMFGEESVERDGDSGID